MSRLARAPRPTYLLLAALASLVSLECINKPLSPVLPNWNTQLSIPITDTTWTLNDAFGGDSDITVTPAGYEYKPMAYYFPAQPVGDTSVLQLQPTSTDTTIGNSLNNIEVTTPGSKVTTFDMGRLAGIPTLPLDTSIAYPGSTDFDSILVITGGMQLVLTNTTPMNFPPQIVKIVNLDGDTIATFDVGEIDSGQSPVIVNADLSGKVFTTAYTGVFNVPVSTSPAPTSIDSTLGLTYTFVCVGPFKIHWAGLLLSPVIIADTSVSQFTIDDSTFVDSVSFKRGTIFVTLTNTVNATVNFTYTFQELVNRGTGLPLSVEAFLGPDSTETITYDLDTTGDGYLYESPHPDDNQMRYSLHISTLQTTNHTVIYDTSGIHMRVQLLDTPFLIKSMSGRLKPTYFTIDQGVGIGNPVIGGNFLADSIKVNIDTLGFGFFTAAGHPIDFHLTLYGYRGGQFIAELPLEGNDASGQQGIYRYLPGQTNIVTFKRSDDSAFVNRFLQKFQTQTPDSMSIDGYAVVDPIDVYNKSQGTSYPGYRAFMADTMNLYSHVAFEIPMSVAIYNGEFYDDQTIGAEDSAGHKSIDPALLTSIVSGKLNVSVNNTFPFHFRFEAFFIDTLANDTLVTLDSLVVRPGAYTQTLRLSRAQSIHFAQANKFHAALYIDTQDTTAALTPTERIKLKISGTIVFNVNPDKLKNE